MITSDKNPKIQLVRGLIDRSKDRKKHNVFVCEGVRLVEEALLAQWETVFLLISDNLSERGLKLAAIFQEKSIPVEQIPYTMMQKLADTETPQGILAVVKQPVFSPLKQLDFALICDTIRNPGNLGTILRTADAANVQTVFLTPGTTDPFAPKVVRAGMGAHFHIPIIKMDWSELNAYFQKLSEPLKIYSASADAETTLWGTNLTQPAAILIGSEAFGPSQPGLEASYQKISIPMPGKSESLNAAVAAGILLFEVVRQRKKEVDFFRQP